MMFADREEAGLKLAEKLTAYQNRTEVVVLGLPRGGVIVGRAVARKLHAPLDILVTRKIGFPGNPEFAAGAINEEGDKIIDQNTLALNGLAPAALDPLIKTEQTELKRRLETYRLGRPPLKLEGKVAIIVDDGIATGATVRAAIKSARAKGAAKVVVATPVIAPDTLRVVAAEADTVVYLEAPASFAAVGEWYEDFPQTTDEEVIKIMRQDV